MSIHNEAQNLGDWLFRNRGRFPALLIPLLMLALRNSRFIEKNFGTSAEACWEVFAILVSSAGLIVRAATVGWVPEGTSGRNTKGQLAGTLNVDGMYASTRHPLYFGNFLIMMGFVLFVQVWWFAAIFVLSFFIFYEHILFCEEAFLAHKFEDAHKLWALKTPAFFPDFRLWRTPARPFSWRMVFKREYSTAFGIITAFVSLNFFSRLLSTHIFEIHSSSVILVGVSAMLFVIVRHLRKYTKVLHVEPCPAVEVVQKNPV